MSCLEQGDYQAALGRRREGRAVYLRVLSVESLNMEQNLSFCLFVYSCLLLLKRSLYPLSHSSKEG